MQNQLEITIEDTIYNKVQSAIKDNVTIIAYDSMEKNMHPDVIASVYKGIPDKIREEINKAKNPLKNVLDKR